MKFYLSLFLFFGTAFAGNKQSLSGEYMSLWGETLWTYKFETNGNYVFTTSGHFGDSKTIGSYRFRNDTVFLMALPASKQPDPKSYFRTDTLFKLSDTCFVDLSLGYEYCKTKGSTIMASRKRNVHKKGMPLIQ